MSGSCAKTKGKKKHASKKVVKYKSISKREHMKKTSSHGLVGLMEKEAIFGKILGKGKLGKGVVGKLKQQSTKGALTKKQLDDMLRQRAQFMKVLDRRVLGLY